MNFKFLNLKFLNLSDIRNISISPFLFRFYPIIIFRFPCQLLPKHNYFYNIGTYFSEYIFLKDFLCKDTFLNVFHTLFRSIFEINFSVKILQSTLFWRCLTGGVQYTQKSPFVGGQTKVLLVFSSIFSVV